MGNTIGPAVAVSTFSATSTPAGASVENEAQASDANRTAWPTWTPGMCSHTCSVRQAVGEDGLGPRQTAGL